MDNPIGRLLGRKRPSGEPDALGEDMVPSPSTLAERSALSSEAPTTSATDQDGPFCSSVKGPVRDFAT